MDANQSLLYDNLRKSNPKLYAALEEEIKRMREEQKEQDYG